MALRRLTTGNKDILISNTLLRSLSPFSRSIHNPTQSHSQIPPTSRRSLFSNVFDPLASPARSISQSQPMNQSINKFHSLFSMSRGSDIRNAMHLNMYNIDGIKAEMRRSFSTTVDAVDKKMESKMNVVRPLSPHLPIYQPQINSAASIFNRISGAYLTAYVGIFYLMTMKLGLVCFTHYNFYQLFFYSSKLFLISSELAGLALGYHLYHGVRHLSADFTGNLGKKAK